MGIFIKQWDIPPAGEYINLNKHRLYEDGKITLDTGDFEFTVAYAEPSDGVALHGWWVDAEPGIPDYATEKGGMSYFCSNCLHPAGKHKHKTYKFCPWCGAKMDGGTEK